MKQRLLKGPGGPKKVIATKIPSRAVRKAEVFGKTDYSHCKGKMILLFLVPSGF
jgi:hypothetical protein